MIRGYFDETSDDQLVYSIGGWVMPVDRWKQFAEDWSFILEERPRIEYFKHNEAMGTKGQFRGWSGKQRDAKIVRLAGVITNHVPDYGMASTLNLGSFLALFESSKASRRQIDSILHGAYPFPWCFHNLTASVLQYELATRSNPQKVEFVFDEHQDLRECIREYEGFKTRLPPEMQAITSTCSSANDRQVPGLQAADLLCGQLLNVSRGIQTHDALRVLLKHCQIFRTNVESDWPTIKRAVQKIDLFWTAKLSTRVSSKGTKKR